MNPTPTGYYRDGRIVIERRLDLSPDEDECMLVGEVRGADEGESGAVIAFLQITDDPEKASAIGPGREFYLDRFVTAGTGGDPEAIDFDHYYPSMADYYRALPG